MALTTDSATNLFNEMLETVGKELAGNLARKAEINFSESSITLIVKGPDYLNQNDLVLRRCDVVEHSINGIFQNPVINHNIFCILVAIDYAQLMTKIVEQQTKDIFCVIYFNGFDRTAISDEIKKIDYNRKVISAIWLCTSERENLQTLAMAHTMKKMMMRIHELKQQLIVTKSQADTYEQRIKNLEEEGKFRADAYEQRIKYLEEEAKFRALADEERINKVEEEAKSKAHVDEERIKKLEEEAKVHEGRMRKLEQMMKMFEDQGKLNPLE